MHSIFQDAVVLAKNCVYLAVALIVAWLIVAFLFEVWFLRRLRR